MGRILAVVCLCAMGGIASAQNFPDFLRKMLPQLPIPGSPRQGQSPGQPQSQQQVQQPGFFGDTPEKEEIAIGRQLAGNLLGAVPLMKNDALQGYVNKVGRWVANQSERPDLNWYFGILESGDLNAFALPGGYVFVTKGLYGKLSNEAELAGVLGHEIGHVVMKHHIKVLKQSQIVSAASGLISRGIAQSRENNPMIQNLLGNGAVALARGLDKDAEYEADRIGVVLATRSGYDPYGLPAVLQKIARVNPGDASMALLFKTHPRPQDRLMNLGDSMKDLFDRYGDGKIIAERFAATTR